MCCNPLVGQLDVIELDHALWSDWVLPERIVETLRMLEKKPAFPMEMFKRSAVTSMAGTPREMGYQDVTC
jgi:hypothetical protein